MAMRADMAVPPAIKELLNTLAARFGDYRQNLFEVSVRSARGKLIFSGRVLDESTRRALETTLNENFPDLVYDDSAVRVLQQARPAALTVATNLTGLYRDSHFESEMLSQLVYGTPLELLDERDQWAFVRLPDGYLGWTYRPYLKLESAPAATHIVTAAESILRSGPDAGAGPVTRVMGSTRVKVSSVRGEWAEVTASRPGWMPLADLIALEDLPRAAADRRAAVIAAAEKFVGVPYLWGGCSALGLDCSGLVHLVHSWVGLNIPRDADLQFAAGRRIDAPFRPGDLIFFKEGNSPLPVTHAALCVGGWKIIHASQQRNGVYYDDVQAVDYLRTSVVGGCTFIEG